MKNQILIFSSFLSLLLIGCNDNDTGPDLDIPEQYIFMRDGESTVDFSGQTARLDMLAEMKAYIATAHEGAVLSEQKLLNMYANENDPFSSEALNTSGKKLEDKTFLADVDFFKEILKSAATHSAGLDASDGQGGLVARGTDRKILVNEKGWEYTQIVEKGLMGSVFLNQIFNQYLTESKTGDGVENDLLVDGKNYTSMEHHWDEAFGYWGVPIDFDSGGDNRFWGNYTYGRESVLGSATTLKNAFLTGRSAIVAKAYTIRDQQKEIIYEQFELIAAATAIHYINESITDLNNGDQGNLLHHASEGYGFVRSLKLSPFRSISENELNTILNSNLGTDGNFWTITLEGLNAAKTSLTNIYPQLANVADEL